MGPSGKKFEGCYGPHYIHAVACNLSGLIGIRPPTADFETAHAFALITLFMINGFGLSKKGLVVLNCSYNLFHTKMHSNH